MAFLRNRVRRSASSPLVSRLGGVIQLQGPPRPRNAYVEEATFFFQLPALQRAIVRQQPIGDPEHKHVVPLAAFGRMNGGERHCRRVEGHGLCLKHSLQAHHRRHAARCAGSKVKAIAQVLVLTLASAELEVGEASLGKPAG